jgi:hypothetical protein
VSGVEDQQWLVGLWWLDHKVLRQAGQHFKPYLVALWQKAGRALFFKPSDLIFFLPEINLELSVLGCK